MKYLHRFVFLIFYFNSILPMQSFKALVKQRIISAISNRIVKLQFSNPELQKLEIKTNFLLYFAKNRFDNMKVAKIAPYLNPDFNLSKHVHSNKRKVYRKLLLQNSACINNNFGKNLFFYAVFNRDYEMVLLLLKLGINVNQTIEIIEGEEIPILNFADENIKDIIEEYRKYYLETSILH